MSLPDFNILVRTIGLEDMFSGDTHGAKAMQDGPVKPSNCSKFGKDLVVLETLISGSRQHILNFVDTYMQWIAVST